MSNNPFDENDPTIPFNPTNAPQPEPGQQGKLVLGNFENDPRRPQRRPYQYQPAQQPQQPNPNYPPQQHAQHAPQGQGYPQQQGQRPAFPPYMQQQPAHQSQLPPFSPAQNNAYQNQNVASPVVPVRQPGVLPGTPAQPGRPTPKRPARARSRKGCLITAIIVIVLLCVLGAIFIPMAQRVLAFGSAISTQPPLSSQNNYMNTSDRVNLLVMGFGGGNHDGAYLTDSMIVVSIIPSTHHTTLISVPRDLWVQVPANSGNYGKLNSVYTIGSNGGKDAKAGGAAAAAKLSTITGLDIKYWMTIDFTGFRDLINAIGGVDVYVPDSFNACYPKNDNANIDASWIKVQFNKGQQHMNGETAIRYARAREPLEVCGMGTSQNLAELTDFGRSARQQIIIKAVLAKAKQSSTWPHLYGAMDALQKTIYTNLSLADLAQFSLKMDLNDPHTQRVGLSNQNVLMDSQSSDGQYILLPQNNNWQAIKDYIKQHLYS